MPSSLFGRYAAVKVRKKLYVTAQEIVRYRQVVNAEDSTNILRFITDNYSAFKMAAESSGASGFQTFTDLFRSKVKESLEACKCRYADVMVTKNHIKKGIGGDSAEAYLYSGLQRVDKLRDLSAVGSVLDREVSDQPAFFTYVLCNEKDKDLCRARSSSMI